MVDAKNLLQYMFSVTADSRRIIKDDKLRSFGFVTQQSLWYYTTFIERPQFFIQVQHCVQPHLWNGSFRRVARERKERQRLWAQRKTPRTSKTSNESTESEPHEEEVSQEEVVVKNGMLPNNIVNLLAAREKKTFSSDSEEEKIDEKAVARKKKRNGSGAGPVILNEMPRSHCLQNSLEFLKKRKMQVPRSTAILENSSQALRLISSSDLLGKK